MARLTPEKKAQAIGGLMEGLSQRAVCRLTGLSRERLSKLILQMGRASERLLEENIRGFECEQIECDELWTFILKRRNRVRPGDPAEAGDAWVWSSVDPDSKLIPAHHVGGRGLEDAHAFARQLRRRIAGRVQLNTDRLHTYRSAILGEFTEDAPDGGFIRPDWATIVKHFEIDPAAEGGKYVPPRVASMDRRAESGDPDMRYASTSHVESHHLQFRMRNRRVARLTNGHSKSLAHLRAATATYFAHYNFVRRHSSVRTAPAVAAGLLAKPMSLSNFVEWSECFR